MKAVVTASLLVLIISGVLAPAHATAVGANVDIAGEVSPDRQRVEPTIAIDPRNPNIIVAGAQDLRLKVVGEHRWDGFYRSTDGGLSWSSSLLPGFPGDFSTLGIVSPLHHFNATTDPVIAFDSSGNAYYTGIASNTSSISSLTVFVAKYVNDGANFAGVTLITGFPLADKPWITVDTTGGPHDGNVYLVFDGPRTLFTRSVDGGLMFSVPIEVPGGGILPGIAVDGAGNIFVSTDQFGVRENKLNILVSRSSDGGASFPNQVRVARITPLPNQLPGNAFRTPTIPQIAADNRGVYIVWNDFGTGNAEVLFASSTDGGNSWTLPVMVNDVTSDQQFFPTITTSAGIISIAWYDSRLGQLPSGTITGLDVFYAESTNAGASFSPNVRVTTISFDPNTVLRTDANAFQPFMGDYISISATPTVVHPIWTDNRNACDSMDPTFGCVDQDAFTATLSVRT